MARITHTQIEITKNPMLKVPIVVPQWEAHVVLALWGDDANVTGTVVLDRKMPEVNDEFTRLANKYGPRDEDIPFVARVYGSFGPGLRSLEQEFSVSVAGSRIGSSAQQVSEVRLDVVAPAQLAGFDGSVAPAAPVLDTAQPDLTLESSAPSSLSDAEIDAIDNVDALAGNTVGGVPVNDYLAIDAVAEAAAEDADAAADAKPAAEVVAAVITADVTIAENAQQIEANAADIAANAEKLAEILARDSDVSDLTGEGSSE